ALEVGGRRDVTRENTLTKAGREALELRVDARHHVDLGAVRHVAVRPRGVLTRRRARVVEEALLPDEHERPLGRLAAPHRALGCRDLVERASEVHCARAPALRGAPGGRTVERVVPLDDATPA